MSGTPAELERLIVFVRAPRPGTVKTRLAASLGAEGAARAYRQLVEHLLSRLDGLAQIELRFTPDDSQEEIGHWLRPGWQARPQGSGDLGARMHAAFREAFADGVTRMLIIGSDCPEISREDILGAWAKLREAEVVFGPAADGGYWLIGLKVPRPTLFKGIAWSTDTVFADTLLRVKTAGLSYALLRVLRDIDTPKDWAESGLSNPES